ncbi:MAG: PAS domain-containing sensor histidine kinase [Alphaproteobacteria bacterium]|nr:PAS domain-containing sensor histidine kinase [Alphaproteobacteria bacterium]
MVTDQNHTETSSSRSGLLPIAVCVSGVILSSLLFVLTSMFTAGIVSEEYEAIPANTSEVLAEGSSSLKQTVDFTASLIDTQNLLNSALFSERMKRTIPGLGAFDQLLWLHPDETGQWQTIVLYEPDSPPEKIHIDNTAIESLTHRDIFQWKQAGFITNLPGLNQKSTGTPERRILYKPLAIIAPVHTAAQDKGLVIGITKLSSILNLTRLDELSYLSALRVTDLSTSELLFQLDNQNAEQRTGTPVKQTYDIGTGNEKWEVSIEFYKYTRLLLLENIAPLVLAFGLCLSAIATLYVRSNVMKSRELARITSQIEAKNLDLQQEIQSKADLFETLQKSESENRAIIDSVSDIIFEVDTKGDLLFLSAAWHKVTGFPVKQSLGTNLFSLISPEDQNQQRKDFELLVTGNKEAYRSYTKLRSSEGRFRAVELAFSVIRTDENGNPRVVGTFTDIEDRRKAERALSVAEKKYRNIVENAPSGIYQMTPEGLYLSANFAFARILGYGTAEDILAGIKNANQSVYVSARERINFIRELDDKGTISNHEAQVFRRDGSKIWISESARVVRDDNGGILYYEGSIEDITERKTQEEALHEAKVNSDLASRAKSEFLANMSHELRTPLNAIIGFSDIIGAQAFGEIKQPEYIEYATNINESGKHLLKIINEILDISKIEAGDRQLNEGRVDLHKVVKSCLELYAGKIETGRIDITDMMAGIPKVIGEELAIKQVVMNIISNAVKFTPSGGRLTLSYEVDKGGRLRIAFTDTGVGLDEHQIKKALSPFGQVDNDLSRSGSGTGLGLTLVSSLMKLHDGELELFSQKGIGTTVTIVFPVERVTISKDSETETA